MEAIRLQIRELLMEEIGRLKAAGGISSPKNTEEVVSMKSDSDLNAFAKRLIELCQDKNKQGDILSGQYRFKLSQATVTRLRESTTSHAAVNSQQPPTLQQVPQQIPTHAQFDKRMITERDIENLPEGTKSISIIKSAVFTPLARDEVRRRNINLQRIAS
jgi:hypothetical protein